MDFSFWLDAVHPEIDESPFAENVQHFLGSCADSDHDGLTDLGEEEAGTDPEAPDSDEDGLCDGYRSVAGVCIAGESVFQDTDADGLADPLDTDDDGDGLPTRFERDAELASPNADDDKIPAWLDLDSDNNDIWDTVEGFTDHDRDGIPSITDRGDAPENCDEDADCDVQPDSVGCNEDFASLGDRSRKKAETVAKTLDPTRARRVEEPPKAVPRRRPGLQGLAVRTAVAMAANPAARAGRVRSRAAMVRMRRVRATTRAAAVAPYRAGPATGAPCRCSWRSRCCFES